ncbi:MAG: X-Pro dipeptidyl-peptidase domain-containing protein, partial [Gammaproteobacteria bacterium]|nr:X-Pro dipeptidyl-peptidase domain-containing protein [Gammaproteobacteria bacterium]
LDPNRSTELHPFLRHQRALPLSPGERVEVRIEILPSSTLFRAGESLVLRVQGTELPGAGGIGHILGVNAGSHIVHVGGATPSHLILPVIPQ